MSSDVLTLGDLKCIWDLGLEGVLMIYSDRSNVCENAKIRPLTAYIGVRYQSLATLCH